MSHAPLYALAAAFLFSIGAHVISLSLRDMDPRTCSLVNIAGSAGLYWLVAPFVVEIDWWFTSAALLFMSIGLFRPLLSSNLSNAGNKMLGPTLNSTMTATTPFFSITMGVLFLNETISWQVLVGALFVVSGVIVIVTRKRDREKNAATDSWPLWALLLPMGAAFFRSLAHVFTKLGMAWLPSAFFAGMLSYSVSFAVALGSDGFRKTSTLERVRSRGTSYALLAGVLNGIAIMSLNTALKIGDLVEVAPIVACGPVFSLLLSWLVFKREALTLRLVVAVALVVPGVVLVSLRSMGKAG